MLRTGRRCYSQGFNIASYVERIQEIAKKQNAPKQPRQGRPQRQGQPRKPKAAAEGRAQEGRPQEGQAKPRAQNQFKPREGQAQAKPRDGQAQFKPREGQAQFKPREGQTQFKPRNGQAQPKPRAASDGQPRAQFKPQAQASSQAPGQSAGQRFQKPAFKPKAESTPANLQSGAMQAFAFQENKPAVRKPRGQKPGRRPKRQGPNARITVKPTTTSQNRQAASSVPLVVSAKESLDAVLKNTSSGFIEIDTLQPSSIASSLVRGPSFNSRFWSVVNSQKVTGDVSGTVEAAVNNQINGDFAPFMIEGDKISENAARTLSGNASLSTDQKQFLAKVAAGSMAPAQVKQMRI